MARVIRGLSRLCRPKINLFIQRASYAHSDVDYRLRIAMPWDNDNVMKMMCEAYLPHEPSIINIGLANKPVPAMVYHIEQALKEGKTIIAVDEGTNCVVGAAVNASSCPFHAERMIQYAEACECGASRDLLKFYAFMHNQVNLWAKYKVRVVFDCAYVAVHPEHCGNGIGKALIAASWNLARNCGYHVIRIDCTNVYTARIAEQLGWKCVYQIPYRRYIECGETIFTNIVEPHTEARVFIDRPLSDKCEDESEITCEC